MSLFDKVGDLGDELKARAEAALTDGLDKVAGVGKYAPQETAVSRKTGSKRAKVAAPAKTPEAADSGTMGKVILAGVAVVGLLLLLRGRK